MVMIKGWCDGEGRGGEKAIVNEEDGIARQNKRDKGREGVRPTT